MVKKIIIPTIVLAAFLVCGFVNIRPDKGATKTSDVSLMNAENIYEPIVVLELFTSQGCSSCPPADRLLNKVKQDTEKNIFALSYHVDYWNYIGWKDPFSKAAYAQKQREYNNKLKYRGNYTPEVIVNGKEHFVGSSAAKMQNSINAYSNKKPPNAITISNVVVDAKSIGVDYELLGNLSHKKLRLVLVLDERVTEVKRGENRNRTLTNSNIVVAEKYSAAEDTKGFTFITIPEIVGPEENIHVMLLMEDADLDITAAAKASVSR